MAVRLEQVLPALRAEIIRILIEKYGFTKIQASRLLNVSPAAVTHYLGKRRGKLFNLKENVNVSNMIYSFVDKIVTRNKSISESDLYDLALRLSSLLEESSKKIEYSGESSRNKLIKVLRERAQAEHEAAEEFMETATKLNNEVTRMIFRQIASDSIKHADILMSTINLLEHEQGQRIEVPRRHELLSLLKKEEEVHIHSLDKVKDFLPHKLLKVIVESVEADEKKHAKILRSLLELAEE